MNRFAILITLLLCTSVSYGTAESQDFDDFFDSADDEFKRLKKEADDKFSSLKKSVDDEFGDLLANAWREFELARGLVRDETPKPVEPPVAHPARKPEPEPEQQRKDAATPDTSSVHPSFPEPVPTPPPVTKEPVPDTPQTPVPPPAKPGPSVTFDFFNIPIAARIDRNWKPYSAGSTITPETIRNFWAYYNRSNYIPFLEDCIDTYKTLRLNDWGYCRLLNNASYELFPHRPNNRSLFVWFMLMKSGFNARVGFSDDKVFVLIPSEQTIFQARYYELEGENFYITSLGRSSEIVSSLFTYEGHHEEASRRIDFTLKQTPLIGRMPHDRTLSFDYDGSHDITIDINRRIVDFLEYYPQTDLDIYFQAVVDAKTEKTLLDGLRPLIEGKNEYEAVNTILRFVQTAFEYQTDDEQFQYENYLFPEETLFYPYCDCEDRSFLFGHLVGKLVGLDVVGLLFPGHVATAVGFSSEVSGDGLIYRGKRYVICDPTYINANIGECMPRFKNVEAEIIPVPSRND